MEIPPEYDPATSDISGFLIDLDGTMYTPHGLIEGAETFYSWLVESKIPFVFLSNTGAKGSTGVQKKFASTKYKISDTPVSLRNIWTASEAQMNFMMHKKEDTPYSVKGSQRDLGLPYDAKVFVMAGGDGFWLNALRMKDSLRVDSWDIRTSLSEKEAKDWALEASKSKEKGQYNVFVVMFLDGKLDKVSVVEGDSSGRNTSYTGDWNYELIRNASFLLHHGAKLIYTADDAFNPSEDPEYPGMVFPLPGPGMFATMLSKLARDSYRTEDDDIIACAGKGGCAGDIFMMDHAISMLKLQGHSGDKSKIMMIGDRFDTDIRGGKSVGIKTCLVESGAHVVEQQQNFEFDRADWTAPSVASLVPDEYLKEKGEEEHFKEMKGLSSVELNNWQSAKSLIRGLCVGRRNS